MRFYLTVAIAAFAALAARSAWSAEQTITLHVDNMTCASCPITVKASLMEVDGVRNASVSEESETAVVTFDDEKTSIADLVNATTNAGYPAQAAAAQ